MSLKIYYPALMLVLLFGCAVDPPVDTTKAIKACADACQLGGNSMRSYSPTEGCVCSIKETKPLMKMDGW